MVEAQQNEKRIGAYTAHSQVSTKARAGRRFKFSTPLQKITLAKKSVVVHKDDTPAHSTFSFFLFSVFFFSRTLTTYYHLLHSQSLGGIYSRGRELFFSIA